VPSVYDVGQSANMKVDQLRITEQLNKPAMTSWRLNNSIKLNITYRPSYKQCSLVEGSDYHVSWRCWRWGLQSVEPQCRLTWRTSTGNVLGNESQSIRCVRLQDGNGEWHCIGLRHRVDRCPRVVTAGIVLLGFHNPRRDESVTRKVRNKPKLGMSGLDIGDGKACRCMWKH